MDLNELLHAHQIAVIRASVSGDAEGRRSHFDKVALYAEQIRRLRESRRSADPAPLPASAQTIIYGTYAGESAPDPRPAALQAWESEGGSLHPPEVPRPGPGQLRPRRTPARGLGKPTA